MDRAFALYLGDSRTGGTDRLMRVAWQRPLEEAARAERFGSRLEMDIAKFKEPVEILGKMSKGMPVTVGALDILQIGAAAIRIPLGSPGISNQDPDGCSCSPDWYSLTGEPTPSDSETTTATPVPTPTPTPTHEVAGTVATSTPTTTTTATTTAIPSMPSPTAVATPTSTALNTPAATPTSTAGPQK